MRNKVITLVTLCAVALSPTLLAAAAPALTPVACASPAAPVRIAASVPADAASAKIYYKAAGQTLEYYSDMRRAADGSMWAFIPYPEATTKSFTYRVVSTDAKGMQLSSSILTAMTAASCPAQTLSADEQRAAAALIVGLTANGQSAVPTGFQCKNVVSYISASGELRQNDECRRLLAGLQSGQNVAGAQPGQTLAGAQQGQAGTTAVVEAESNRRAAAIILTGAGLIGAGVIYNNKKNKDKEKPVSKSRP